MADAVILSAPRTATGTARRGCRIAPAALAPPPDAAPGGPQGPGSPGAGRRGSLIDLDAFDLAKYAVQEALKRSGIPVEDVDDIVLGEVLQGGGDIARYVAVELGMLEVP